MKVLHTIRDTPPNLAGLCTLSNSSENCYLAYPGSNTIGEVQIFDAINLVSSQTYSYLHSNNYLKLKVISLIQQAKTMIPAHDSPLAALAFNPIGTKVATASEKGTVIRVFHVSLINNHQNKYIYYLLIKQILLQYCIRRFTMVRNYSSFDEESKGMCQSVVLRSAWMRCFYVVRVTRKPFTFSN